MGLFSGISKAVRGVVGGLTGSTGASLLGSALGYLGQQDANATNMNIAGMNNQTAIELANTAYQRKVKDLNAAGLNPMLAYINGSGGGASGAAVPQLQQAHVENSAAAASDSGMKSANARLLESQIATQESQTAANSAQAAKTSSEKIAIDLQNRATAADLDANLTDRVFTTGKELSHRAALAITEEFRASNDWNAIHYLNELAVKNGFRNYQEAIHTTDFKSQLLDLYQRKLRNNELESMSLMWGSDFGKNVAPYLNSAKDMSSIGAGAAFGAGQLLKKAPIINKSTTVIKR